MANRIDRIIGLAERLIASGRTRLLATLVAIGCLTWAMRFDRPNGIWYACLIVIALAVFIVAKSISDVKEGPAQHGEECETTEAQDPPDPGP